MNLQRDSLQHQMSDLANRGVLIGTSSWKYPGWRGQIYDDARYVWHGRFSEARFERLCLSEYAEVFKTVCVDAAYYKFPDSRFLEGLLSQVPQDFLFAFKVTDQITLKRFSNLPRHGSRAGATNPDFLNSDLFDSAFLQPCKPFKANIGLLIFEFSHFYQSDFERGRDFVQALEQFLMLLPKGWRYGVEIRNPSFLHPEYFAALARHEVAHVYNSWEGMPPLNEQISLPDSRTHPDFFGARLLLRPGRKYEDAVKLFSPYQEIKDPYPEGRTAAARLMERTLASGKKTKGFIYINNRFEGNALQSIERIINEVDESPNETV